ncbi:MAG: hypothetical protein WBZ36_23860 [Candidatus Nitrosopolaris sp.]
MPKLPSEEITKCSSSCCSYNQTLSEEHEERIEREIDNNGHFEENSDIAEPVEIIREEVVEVVENPTAETFPLSSTGSQHEEE